MSAKIIDGKSLATELRQETRESVLSLRQLGIYPHLAVCIVGEDPASHIYVKNKIKACSEVGIQNTCAYLPDNVSEDDLLRVIKRWNQDSDIHGILVQLPLPNHINLNEVVNSINPDKDVDGFHCMNLGCIVQKNVKFMPCTPMGVMHIFDKEKIALKGKHVVIINDSIVVGRPLSMMLLNRDATVTVCNKYTENITKITRSADILVVAVGKRPEFNVSSRMIRKNAVVIDVGINRLPNGMIVGDVDKDAIEVASHLTPVPGCCGLLTVAHLMKNTEKACRLLMGLL